MPRNFPSLTGETRPLIVAARCRGCGLPRRLDGGVVASASYCQCCSTDRLSMASALLRIRPLTPEDLDGPYVVRLGR